MHLPTETEPAGESGFAGPWFMAPTFDSELERRNLDPADRDLVRSFAENGFLVLDDLGLDDFSQTANGVVRALEPLHEGGTYNRISDAWDTSPDVLAIATAPEVMRILRLLYGRRPIPFQTLNFWKGSQQKTHSDAVHFHSFPHHLMCGVWVALEDTDDRNGALHYYPGSHRLPVVEFADLGLAAGKDFYPRYEAFVDELVHGLGLRKEVPFLRRGQAIIWAANLLHGGDTITDPESTRVSQVTHYYFENCSYYTPLRSDLARGKVFFRQITNVETGKLVPARVNGRRLPVPLLSRGVTAKRWLTQRLGKGLMKRHAA